jgi:hypothetical protein
MIADRVRADFETPVKSSEICRRDCPLLFCTCQTISYLGIILHHSVTSSFFVYLDFDSWIRYSNKIFQWNSLLIIVTLRKFKGD